MAVVLRDSININGGVVWHSGNHGAGSGLHADILDGFHAASFLRSVNGVGPDGNGNVSVNLNPTALHRVRFDGINRGSYGSISVSGSVNGYAGIDFGDAAVTLMIGNAGNPSGFYRDNSTWLMYAERGGAIWSPFYGFLHQYFFNTVTNTSGVTLTNPIYYTYTAVDGGGNFELRISNCNCHCNCNCNCCGGG